MTFLDILEENNIPFVFDGVELHFLHNASEVLARELWHHLTGTHEIGKYT